MKRNYVGWAKQGANYGPATGAGEPVEDVIGAITEARNLGKEG